MLNQPILLEIKIIIFGLYYKNNIMMKIGDKVLISPQVTGREDWIEGTVLQIEDNPFVGIVITAKSDDGETFFEKEYLFKKIELCTQ